MDSDDGATIGEAVLDAVAYAEEQFMDTTLMAVAVVLMVRDKEGQTQVVTHSVTL